MFGDIPDRMATRADWHPPWLPHPTLTPLWCPHSMPTNSTLSRRQSRIGVAARPSARARSTRPPPPGVRTRPARHAVFPTARRTGELPRAVHGGVVPHAARRSPHSAGPCSSTGRRSFRPGSASSPACATTLRSTCAPRCAALRTRPPSNGAIGSSPP